MSNVFKRPMFRKGGNVGTGIMTGITDRTMHADNPIVTGNDAPVDYEKMFMDRIIQSGGLPQGMDPLTTYLLEAGPKIAKSTSFADMIANLEDPNKTLIEEENKKAEFLRNLRTGAAQFGLEKEFTASESDLDRKNRLAVANVRADASSPNLTLEQKIELRTEGLMEEYRNNKRYATNHARYIEEYQNDIPPSIDKGVIKDSKALEKKRKKGKKEEGNVYFDVTDGIAKILVLDEATGVYRWKDYFKFKEEEKVKIQDVNKPGKVEEKTTSFEDSFKSPDGLTETDKKIIEIIKGNKEKISEGEQSIVDWNKYR
jgi:hypothetical protein